MKINNLTKKFGSKVIFNNFSLEFQDNKVNYLLGESGVGKTTILRIIAGLDKDFKGEIVPSNAKISCVFQEPRLFPKLTLKENVEIVSESSKYKIEDLLEILELENEVNSLPSSLSGGMKMRASIARALYHDGDVYLMDEPFAALNDELKARALPKIFELLKGKTVIIVTHNVEEANKFADKIINLDLLKRNQL